MADRLRLPLIGTMIGDPCGIGPEVTVKAWASADVRSTARHMLIGDVRAVEDAVRCAGLTIGVRRIDSVDDFVDVPGRIDVLDTGLLDWGDVTPGHDSEGCGRATAYWLDQAHALARAGVIDAVAMGPISSTAMKMASVLDRVVGEPGGEFLTILSGALRVVHVTDHIPLRDVCSTLDTGLVGKAIDVVDSYFQRWGFDYPRIGVCGVNPHAAGREEEMVIAPAIAVARDRGLSIEGPLSPDAAFRQCVEGRFDVIIAMYHDQGHIPVKTLAFAGNCAFNIGKLPYVVVGTPHGTAYDIVGRGIADASMMRCAMRTAGVLAAGGGPTQLD